MAQQPRTDQNITMPFIPQPVLLAGIAFALPVLEEKENIINNKCHSLLGKDTPAALTKAMVWTHLHRSVAKGCCQHIIKVAGSECLSVPKPQGAGGMAHINLMTNTLLKVQWYCKGYYYISQLGTSGNVFYEPQVENPCSMWRAGHCGVPSKAAQPGKHTVKVHHQTVTVLGRHHGGIQPPRLLAPPGNHRRDERGECYTEIYGKEHDTPAATHRRLHCALTLRGLLN
ncbi:hypothetical protein E2C01_029805 [Portunus trituberculatus]|uniref:Uncharacterized protein n=1 Tax=Portunus trituberculatus TaxID=210409 RepID=A0A5B7ENV6_PORTR|nr:hypothetical protein [Portunus trituberculatus]